MLSVQSTDTCTCYLLHIASNYAHTQNATYDGIFQHFLISSMYTDINFVCFAFAFAVAAFFSALLMDTYVCILSVSYYYTSISHL